ncbi:MAG: nickel-dependent lactate racemase [Deltaproteobacteria bacterium]|nr:nickel-dependent lactate racemase [Deltaproteobacteria bacterium]MBW1847394.1 nickel-dependent lactate racemase [Deltaproteobacteria bacterium]
MTTHKIHYGTNRFSFSLPRGNFISQIEPKCPSINDSPEAIIRYALDNPIGSPSLAKIAKGNRSAAILVPGKDRIAGAETFIPLLLEELITAGISDKNITIFLATGTHAKHSREEIERLIGKEIASRLHCFEHECNNEDNLHFVGETTYRNKIYINRTVLDTDIKILTGRIIPHYFAGFGGGRKALLPGVSGFETICRNHRLTLNPESGIHPEVRPCSLHNNPVHLDMLEAANMAGQSFVLNTLLDTNHNVIGAFAGDLEQAHYAGCIEAEKIFKIELKEPLDAVITSAGGWPYDCNFMQAIKAVLNVQEIIKPGGSILWIAKCPDGIKDGFLEWAKLKTTVDLEKAVRLNYNLTGHNSIMLRNITQKARVALWSDLSHNDVKALGFEPVDSIQEGVEWLLKSCEEAFNYSIVPYANITYAAIKN